MQTEKKKKNKRTYNKIEVTSSPPIDRINDLPNSENVLTRRSVGSQQSIESTRSPSQVESGADKQVDPDDYRIRATDFTQPDKKFVGAAKNIVARDLLWMFIIWAIIGIVEGTILVIHVTCLTCSIEDLLSMPGQFPIFKSLYEVVSAYGTVGLSLGTGYSQWPMAFSSLWHNASKIVLCVAMILGRHRGLPESVDRAVQLPNLLKKHISLSHQAKQAVNNDNNANARTSME